MVEGGDEASDGEYEKEAMAGAVEIPNIFFEKTQTSRKVRKGLEYSLQELRKFSYVYPRVGILLDLTFTPWPRPLSVLCY